MAAVRSALQRSAINTMGSALGMSWRLVLCRPYPKEGARAEMAVVRSALQRSVLNTLGICHPESVEA